MAVLFVGLLSRLNCLRIELALPAEHGRHMHSSMISTNLGTTSYLPSSLQLSGICKNEAEFGSLCTMLHLHTGVYENAIPPFHESNFESEWGNWPFSLERLNWNLAGKKKRWIEIKTQMDRMDLIASIYPDRARSSISAKWWRNFIQWIIRLELLRCKSRG